MVLFGPRPALDAGLPLESLLRPSRPSSAAKRSRSVSRSARTFGSPITATAARPQRKRHARGGGCSGPRERIGEPPTQGKGQACDRRIAEALKGGSSRLRLCRARGCQNNGKNFITFDGDSAVYSGDVRAVASSGALAEELVVWDEAGPHGERSNVLLPMEYKRRAAVEGIRAMDSLSARRGPG